MKAKRMISILLTLLLAVSMLSGISLSVSAEETTPAALPDGTIFVNLTWTQATLPANTTVNGKTFALTWGTNAFAAAQDGLDAATSGGTVYLFPGEYSGFTIKKNLTVLGAKYGIDPNVKGAKDTDLWTKNANRGTNETVITGNISMGLYETTVYHMATDMTIDGVMLMGGGQIRSNGAAKNNNGVVKIALKNFYIKNSTKTTAPFYLQPFYGMSVAADNQYQRDVTIENVRVEGQTQKELMVLTAEKADISGVYMHTDCTQVFFTTASAAIGFTSQVEWNIHDNMFANSVGRTIYVDTENAKGNNLSLVSDLANRSKVTFNFSDNVFVNSFVASGTNSAFTLAFRPATQNVYLNFDGNVFYNTSAPSSGHACIAGYSAVSGDYSDQVTAKNNKFIGKISNCFSYGGIGGTLDVSGNYTCIDGAVTYARASCANVQDWWWLDEAMTNRSDGGNVPADRLVDLDVDLKWLGRTYTSAERRYFNWSNSGFELNINGTGATAVLSSSNPGGTNTAYLKVYVDGVHTKTIEMNWPTNTVVLAEGLTDGPHTIKVIKRTNARSSTAALVKLWVDEGTEILIPNVAATRKMQFVGDSITVGYGSMATSGSWSTATEDGSITYAALAGQYFGADYHTIAVSGRGIAANYDNTDPENRAPYMYEFTDWNNKAQWNHNDYQPDVIVINYGTNDKSAGVTNANFKAAAKSFVQQVRTKNPNAHIIYAYGFMGDPFKTEVEGLINELRTAGDTKVHYLYLDPVTTSGVDKGVAGHPTGSAHADRAETLIAKVAEITGWNKHTTCEYKETVITAPTCAAAGEGKFVCGVCGDAEIRTTDPTGNHAEDTENVISDTAPTCGTEGVGHTICTVCQQTVNTGVTIPATGEHTWATEWTQGIATHYHACTNDGCMAKKDEDDHDETEILVTPPTCFPDGYGMGYMGCSVCNKVFEAGLEFPMIDHTAGAWKVVKEATTSATGLKEKRCTACGTLLASETIAKKKPAVNFTDVKKSDFFYTPVQWAVSEGITTGTSSTTFGPSESCTRAQAVTFLWRAAGSPAPKTSKNPFVDVKKNDYYYKAVLWAVENGITKGTSATAFSPDESCTRGQIVTFLWRAQGGKKVSASNPFKDVKKSDYYYDAVLWAVKNNVTTGTSATAFSPNDTCTRGQIVTFLYRALVK